MAQSHYLYVMFFQMELEKFLSVLHTQVNSLDKSSLHDDDKALLEEIQLLIDELTQLFDLLNVR